MSEKYTYTFEELKEFIKNQPDERKVNMNDNCPGKGDCGCVLVQFFRKKTKNRVSGCGYSVVTIAKNEKLVNYYSDDAKVHDFIHSLCSKKVTTYKSVKKELKFF